MRRGGDDPRLRSLVWPAVRRTAAIVAFLWLIMRPHDHQPLPLWGSVVVAVSCGVIVIVVSYAAFLFETRRQRNRIRGNDAGPGE
jgi:dolichol kinase